MSKTTTCLNVAEAVCRLGFDAMCFDLDQEQNDLAEICERANIACASPAIPDLKRIFRRPALDQGQPWHIRLVECPPRDTRASRAVLRLADYVLVPTVCEYLALKGLGRVLTAIEEAKEDNPRLQTKVLITMYSPPQRAERDEVRSYAGLDVCKAVIPREAAIAKAVGLGQSVLHTAPKSRGAASYRSLAREIVGWRFPGDPVTKGRSHIESL